MVLPASNRFKILTSMFVCVLCVCVCCALFTLAVVPAALMPDLEQMPTYGNC
jgi:hypothetical protein